MTPDEHRAYLEQTYRKSPEGSARRIWAAAQLAQLQPKTKPVIARVATPSAPATRSNPDRKPQGANS